MLSLHRAILAFALSFSATLAYATPIVLTADHFTVTYDDAQSGIFGAGAVLGSGDTVYFVPTTFTVFSGVAGGADTAQATLELTFTADPGYAFTSLFFTERGDYLLFDGGVVDADASLEAVNADTAASGVLGLSPDAPLDLPGLPTRNWELTGDLAMLALGTPQILQVTLDNTLSASTPTDGMAFVEKKFVGFRLVAEPVPEPASLALLLAGALAALLVGELPRARAARAGRRS